MSNSYRIRTQVGVDKSINVHLEQDFESLEILSLKILQSEIYTRQCADYGVVIGRISINNGFGLPNCRVSIFVPLATEDENNPIVSEIYPYKAVSDINDVGYRYNLLPYVKSYSNHVPTGSFFDKEDILINQSFIEVFDKYYRYTAITNESGDFMIFGVPVGVQTIHVDVDLSDIGEFSLAPQDLIRTGLATEAQVSGTKFKSSSNLNELPQIVSLNRVITVEPLWGQPDLCNIGINRTDFDLSAEANVVIEPTAIFMGSMFSDVDNLALKRNCKPKFAQGELCSLVAGPGEILAIRQTIFNDDMGKPVLEQYELESGGQVIDDNGTWLVDLPMNLDYVTTNEFGERVFSINPQVGIPTRGKYRFKIKWNQSPSLDENVKRAYFLVPNVREYGWTTAGTSPTNLTLQKKSYAFSLSWDDYADPQSAINGEDTFYQFSYNKVYTVSQLIDQYRRGTLANRVISIKNILDNTCESTNNKFPTNDASFRWDFIFLLYTFASYIFRPVLIALVPVVHFLFFLVILLRTALIPLLLVYLGGLLGSLIYKIVGAGAGGFTSIMIIGFVLEGIFILGAMTALGFLLNELFKIKLKGINLPLLLYDQCEFCKCDDSSDLSDESVGTQSSVIPLPPPPPLPNVSGVQITNLEGGLYNSEELIDDSSYIYINQLLTGVYVKFPPSRPTSNSKVPQSVIGRYNPPLIPGRFDYDEDIAEYTTRSITLAERINLFNTKAKYFDEDLFNPGGGVNQIYVSVAPSLNGGGYSYNNNPIQPYNTPGNYHTDNVVVLMMTPDSITNLPIGTLLTFVSPNSTSDKNYTGGTLNEFGNNAITGTSYLNQTFTNSTTAQVTIPYVTPNQQQRQTIYTIPMSDGSSTGNTNYHKFPTDIEYFQVITAITYSDFVNNINNPLNPNFSTQFTPNSLYTRYLSNNTNIVVKMKNNCTDYNDYRFSITPITSLENYEQQLIVILSRGVDPYTTRVETRYDIGKLFGFADPTKVSVSGLYHLNYPIQGSYLNVVHQNLTTDISGTDTYSGRKLYFESFDYIPAPNPSQQQFSAFTSSLPRYYSALDNANNTTFQPRCDLPPYSNSSDSTTWNNGLGLPGRGYTVGNSTQPFNNNEFIYDYNQFFNVGLPISAVYLANQTSPNSPSNSQTQGYFNGEIVEGGGYMIISSGAIPVTPSPPLYFNYPSGSICNSQGYELSKYVAPMYSDTLVWNYTNTQFQNRNLVMRSDRLPTSDRLLINCSNSFALQQNQNLGIYIIPDDGTLNVPSNTGGSSTGAQPTEDNDDGPNLTSDLLNTTNSCVDSRNLSCYRFVPNRNLRDGTNPGGGDFILRDPNDCQKFNNKFIFEKGCYKLVTTVFLSLPIDFVLITEWLSRTNITFGACRNVFSHLFTQNWVNGTLYAFAFKNSKVVDNNGNASADFCPAVIFYDNDTNNFYYRSSPYVLNNGFIGRNAPTSPNVRNLLYPTTIMDLGPRSDYLQELVYSDEYDGYVINQLPSTSYQDVTELLNLLIIIRLVNTNFISKLIGLGGGDIFDYFTRVRRTNITNQRLSVDADYAQMISINSELGVVPFERSAYPNTPAPPAPQVIIDPVYFNNGSEKDGIFGIFYSSNTQIRDFITPKRTIINSQVQLNDSCAFNNFYCYSQEVPFYQWEIKTNQSSVDSIFGSQRNDWFTEPINTNGTFHSFKYQSMDRANSLSRYFKTNTSVFAGDFKGFIYSIDTRDVPPLGSSPFWVTPSLNPLRNSWDINNPKPTTITVGVPFYFYFGLKKGASAWDRFAKKWINFERIQ